VFVPASVFVTDRRKDTNLMRNLSVFRNFRNLCHYAECHVLFIVMLSVGMLTVVAPSVCRYMGWGLGWYNVNILCHGTTFHRLDISLTQYFIDFPLCRPTKNSLDTRRYGQIEKVNLPKTSTRALRSFNGVGGNQPY